MLKAMAFALVVVACAPATAEPQVTNWAAPVPFTPGPTSSPSTRTDTPTAAPTAAQVAAPVTPTPQPVVYVTPVPTVRATVAPAPAATPVLAPPGLTVTITASRYGYVAATTASGALCVAGALLPTGAQSTAAGLAASYAADANGFVSWTYNTSVSTTPGTGVHVVTCSNGGPAVSANASFTVVSSAPAPAPAAGTYVGVGGGHWITKNISSGQYIVLEDQSLWQVDSLDRINTLLWLIVDSITVIQESSCLYGYRLINTDEKETACARYLGYSR